MKKTRTKWITSSDMNTKYLTYEKDIMQIPVVIEIEIVRSSKGIAKPKPGPISLLQFFF